MRKNITHAGVALAVFAGLTCLFLLWTGAFSGRPGGGAGGPAHADDACAQACAAEEEARHADEHATVAGDPADDACAQACAAEGRVHGGGHAPPAAAPAPAGLEQARCEHAIRIIDCDQCRYEVGVVKLQPSVAAALVRTAQVEQAEAVRRLRLTGEVQFDRTRVVEVPAIAGGRVVAVLAQLGQQVQAGEVLAVIHSGDFGEAKVAYLEAYTAHQIAVQEQQRQAALHEALAQALAALQAAQDQDAGQDPLATMPAQMRQPLGEWRSRLVGSLARLQQARAVYQREQALSGSHASSRAAYEEARREFQTAQAEYAATIEEVQLNLDLARLRADNAARQAQARHQAAEQRLRLFGLEEAAIRDAARLQEDGRFAQLELRAPRAGTITSQDVAPGKVVEGNQTLYTIADLSRLWVWCDLHERDLSMLHEALAQARPTEAAVRVAAFGEAEFPGVVDLLGSTIDERARTVKLRVQVANPQGKLRPGMFATVDVTLPSARQASFVPRGAVLRDAGRTFVFQHWRDDLWLRRDVTLGPSQDQWVEVVAGLEPGTTVAAGGAFLLKSDILREKMGAGCAD